MSYTVSDKLPEKFFVDTLTKKAEMLKRHLKDTHSNLVIRAHIGLNMATFKLFNQQEEDSLKLCYTFLNLGDLKDQMYQLWVQLNYILKENIVCMNVITSYIYIPISIKTARLVNTFKDIKNYKHKNDINQYMYFMGVIVFN